MSRRGRNEGSIFQRKDGLWVAQIQIGHDPTGKRKFISYYGKTRREVARKLENSLADINHNTFIQPSKITYEDWFWPWMKTFKKTTVGETTYARYFALANLHILPFIGKMKIQDIKNIHIQNIYNTCTDGGLSPATIKHIHTILSQSFEQAINQNLVFTNPVLKTIRPPIRRKEVTVLTVEQQEKLLSVLKNDTIGTIIKLAIGTGARLGELLGLKWENVDLEKHEIHITQGLVRTYRFDDINHKAHSDKNILSKLKTDSSQRTIPLTSSLVLALTKYKKNQNNSNKKSVKNVVAFPGLVFTNDSGHCLDESNVRKKYEIILKEAGIPYVKFHALRHTFATRILEANVHPKVAQELLGHSTASTTLDIYSHVLPNQKREAINKLEGIV